MANYSDYPDLDIELLPGKVALVQIQRPPDNYFGHELIDSLGNAFEALDEDHDCRCLVLAAAGKNFCAGAQIGGGKQLNIAELYRHAVRLFQTRKPIVGAIQGAAVGGGLGLALVPDFRVACPEARFCANFARLGTHPGFGLSITLPKLVGESTAAMMFFTGRRIKGEQALSLGLVDRLVKLDQVRDSAIEFARDIALSAPLAVTSIRATLRADLADRVAAATEHELSEQVILGGTADFREGVAAMAERRDPEFEGY